jgi:hypothetical protein
MAEEVGGEGSTDDTGVLHDLGDLLEAFGDLAGGGIEGVDVVVVGLKAPSAMLGKALDGINGGHRLSRGAAKRIAAAVHHAPDAEGEFVVMGRFV